MNKQETCKLCFIWTYIIGIATHGFCYFNTTFNHDGAMIYLSDDEWKASLGRYLTPIYRLFRTRYSAPWLTGVLSLAFLSLCAYLTVRMFDLKRKSSIACIGGLYAVNYSLIITNAFCIHDADSYMFSVLLAVASAYCLIAGWPFERDHGQFTLSNTDRKIVIKECADIIVSAILLAGSMALYQAYATLSCALILIYIIKKCLENEKISIILQIFAKTVIMYVLGAIFYIAGLKIYSKAFHIELAEGGHNSITTVFSLEGWNIFGGIKNAYVVFKEYFFIVSKFNRYFPVAANVLVLIAIAAAIIGIFIRQKISIANKIVTIVSLLIFPAVLGALCLITEVAQLMKVQYIAVYFIPLVILRIVDELDLKAYLKLGLSKIVPAVVVTSLFVVQYNAAAFANGIYLAKTLDYQATYDLMGNVIADIGKVEGYVPGQTPVAFIGSPVTASQLSGQRYGYSNMAEMGDLTHDFYYSITGYYTYQYYVKDIMNINMEIMSVQEAQEISQNPEVLAMPLYPSDEAISMVDGVVIVKLNQNPMPI